MSIQKTLIKDITTVETGFILHQVNCRGAMGGGLAAQLRQKLPKCYPPYKELCDSTDPDLKFTLLGSYQTVEIEPYLFVVNLFGQLSTSHGCRETEYHALHMALEKFAHPEGGKLADIPIYVPFGLGCGLGGGDWAIVYKILELVFSDVKNPVYICEMPAKPTKKKKETK